VHRWIVDGTGDCPALWRRCSSLFATGHGRGCHFGTAGTGAAPDLGTGNVQEAPDVLAGDFRAFGSRQCREVREFRETFRRHTYG
jgi:hypothetical protein